ncbi:MAG: YadA-like family protein [Veillonella sp.]|nr:YadA-like family protein [Veillonella sp.]
MRVTKKALVLAACLGCGMVVTGLAADSTPVNPSTSAPAMTFVDSKRAIFIGKDQGYTNKGWVGEVLAIGYGGFGKQDSLAGETVILGNASGENARGATVVGQRAGTNGENSTVIGSNASASMYTTKTTGAVALGSYSKAYATEGEALGYFSEVDAKNERGVALGARSKSTVQAGEKGYLIKDSDGNAPAWVSKMGAVAVGSKDYGNRQITNVAAGTHDDDAANVAQLKRIDSNVNQLDSHINRLDTNINRVGAMSAALSGLHPVLSDDGTKWNVAVAGGSYKGEKAMALGAFYTPNKTTQFSVGSTVGQDSTMFNVGASFKVGPAGESVKPQDSREVRALAKEVENLKAQHEADVDRIAALEAKVNALTK